MLRTAIGLLLLWQPFNAHGGGRANNGGDGVVCYQDNTFSKIISVKLLDYYESTKPIVLGDDSMTILQRANRAIYQLKELDLDRFVIYMYDLATFFDETEFVPTKDDLPEVEDTGSSVTSVIPGHVNIFENNCRIEQLAVQRRKPEEGEKRYYIRSDLFDKMDDVHRAGLLLHEVIYREADTHGVTNSLGVRTLNLLLGRNYFIKQKDPENYFKTMFSLQLVGRFHEVRSKESRPKLLFIYWLANKEASFANADSFCKELTDNLFTEEREWRIMKTVEPSVLEALDLSEDDLATPNSKEPGKFICVRRF